MTVSISGAGLVGSLLATMLAQRGYSVKMFERRPDMRSASISAGKSINLAMSNRGLRALQIAGLDKHIQSIAIPMYCRMMHDEQGNLREQPYGTAGQAINSVSRGELNKTLMSIAEQHGVTIEFEQRCVDIDVNSTTATFERTDSGERYNVKSDIIIGADGAFSAVRSRMQQHDRFAYSQSYLDHSYKELHIPPAADGGFRMAKNALHIWPRHSFMLIALPNLDGSFTCTLFLAHKGNPGFESLKTEADVQEFFERYFPDVLPLMPTLMEDFFTNPESSLVTVKCSPWTMNNVMLIGDAAHAVVPFYGQGMNCGFEDCRVLLDCLTETHDSWPEAMQLYMQYRKPDADAIADLAIENFVEMRDKVADVHFLRRKQLEAFLHQRYPDKFVPQYSLVTFHEDVPYSEAQRISRANAQLVDSLLEIQEVKMDWTSDRALQALDKAMSHVKPLSHSPISPAHR